METPIKTQLLMTFTNRDELEATINEILSSYEILFNHLFVLQNKSNGDELFCTYNVGADVNYRHPELNTILVHRKKHTNTLYTINALNELVRLETGGVSHDYIVPWEEHQNCILLTDQDGLKKISTRIFEIIDID